MRIFAARMKILTVPHNCDTGNKPGADAFLLQGLTLSALPDCALLREGWPFFVPDWDGLFMAQMQLAVRIDRLGKDIAVRFAHRYYREVSVAVQFTSEAHPSVVFDGSVALGKGVPPPVDVRLRLDVDGRPVQSDETAGMNSIIDRVIAHASRFVTLKTGDIILCGAPCTGTPVAEGQVLTGFLNEEPLLHIRVK